MDAVAPGVAGTFVPAAVVPGAVVAERAAVGPSLLRPAAGVVPGAVPDPHRAAVAAAGEPCPAGSCSSAPAEPPAGGSSVVPGVPAAAADRSGRAPTVDEPVSASSAVGASTSARKK